MANPSLQIGNGKFAIKENELLGYSSSGTRFFPIPITMTRATLGTRVNPSGLIEDVELLGSELVSCENFDCADPNAVWNALSGWNIANGKATASPANDYLYQDNVYDQTSVKTYKLTYDITVDSGTFKFLILGKTGSSFFGDETTSGTYTIYFTTTGSSGDGRLYIANQGNFDGDVNSVSVKEATIDDLARVDYTDGTASLLVEPQRTNLLTYSEDFSQSFWTKSSVTLTTGFVSPDGTNNASKLVSTGADGSMQNSYTVSSGTTYTISVYLKTVSGTLDTTIGLGSPGFPQNEGTGGRYKNITVTNEWQRYSLTSTADASAVTGVGFGGFSGFSTGEEVLIWGIQLEESAYPTSYIKTQGSTVTRNQDQYEKTGISDKINSEEGVLFLEGEVKTDAIFAANCIGISDGTGSNRLSVIMYGNLESIRSSMVVGGVTQFDLNLGSGYSHGQYYKIAVSYKVNDCKIFINGTKLLTDTSATMPSIGTFDRLALDLGDSLYPFYGKVKQLQIFKTALSDSELATLTT